MTTGNFAKKCVLKLVETFLGISKFQCGGESIWESF